MSKGKRKPKGLAAEEDPDVIEVHRASPPLEQYLEKQTADTATTSLNPRSSDTDETGAPVEAVVVVLPWTGAKLVSG